MLGAAGAVGYYMVVKAKEPGRLGGGGSAKDSGARKSRSGSTSPAGGPRSRPRSRTAPRPAGPTVQGALTKLHLAVLRKEAARYRGNGDEARRRESEAAGALQEAERISAGRPMPTHLDPLDEILAADGIEIASRGGEHAASVLEGVMRKLGTESFVMFTVRHRGGAEEQVHIFFARDRVAPQIAASGNIPITSQLASQIRQDVLSLPPLYLGETERQRIVTILGRGEATPEEYQFLTRRLLKETAGEAKAEKATFAQRVKALEIEMKGEVVPDWVILKSGRRIDGRSKGETPSGLVMETQAGSIPIPRADIRKVVTAKELREQFDGRFASADRHPGAYEALLTWTAEWQMSVHREYVAYTMLQRNPGDRVARHAAGYEYVDDMWKLGASRPVAQRAKNRTELRPRLEGMGFVERGGKWYRAKDWSTGIDTLAARPALTWRTTGTKVWAWHLDDTPQARIVDGSGKTGGRKTFDGPPNLRFLAPTGTSGTVNISVQAPGEILECEVKASGLIVARGKPARLEVYVTPSGGQSRLLYFIDQGQDDAYYPVTDMLRGRAKFTVSCRMVTTKDDYHTYARFLPSLPDTRHILHVRGRVLEPSPEIDKIWQGTPK